MISMGSLAQTSRRRGAVSLAPTIENSPTQSFAQWKILIVDDEPEVHDVTRLALQRMTYGDRPLEFLSAYSAVKLLN
ncbi:MAG: hypothetical protein R2867_21840 [Caldilineaceae bacterium]